jgi:hypothetical protein
MHAPKLPEVERRVSNVIALFGLEVGAGSLGASVYAARMADEIERGCPCRKPNRADN